MRKFVLLVLPFLIIGIGLLYFSFSSYEKRASMVSTDGDGISSIAMVDSKSFYIWEDKKWKKQFIKGVNMGVGKPAHFPGELAITKEEYLRWFNYIGKMNANSIRVYTILKPAFYDALYEYNATAKNKLYLFHGLWLNEDNIINYNDAYKMKEEIQKDTKNLIDVLHGNCTLPLKPGFASGKYTKDVSPYVIGWIYGIEWDPDFVDGTNKNTLNPTSYQGEFLYTDKASPFETFLCEMGDYAISYESEKYKMQRPFSFTNWVTTDMLKHPNEPSEEEDRVTVNTEHIKKKDTFKPGFFASYHIYPYYPDFMNYQKEYATFKDTDGKIDTYKAYLKDLIKEHTVPVLVAEFGIPAARGMAHKNIRMGFNQGNVDEKSQGEMDKKMLQDIYDTGYAGGLVFTWQDEWFKRTWNTMDFDTPDRRPFWSNPQTNEQEFGMMAFDPGKEKSKCYVDGYVSDWKGDTPLIQDATTKLYMKSDEKYVYFLADLKSYNPQKDKIIIPIDSIANQGNSTFDKIPLKKPSDFVIIIDGKENSKLLVDAYYDSFYYTYMKLKMIEKKPEYEKKNSGVFNPFYLCLNKELFLPVDKITLPFSKYESGKLLEGDGNPDHKEFNSLVDYCIKENKIEIRIPWQLFNFMDPSSNSMMDDLYKNGIAPVKSQGLYAGILQTHEGTVIENSDVKLYSWKGWEEPAYHERLKPSYYILKEAFENIEK